MTKLDNGIELIALDMDGTVTQHKSEIENGNFEALKEIGKRFPVVVVGAGSCKRIQSQLKHLPVDVIGYYGMEYSKYDKEKREFILVEQNKVAVHDREAILQKAEFLRSRFGYDHYQGNSIEFHESGVVTFPLLGSAARLSDKLAFDPSRAKRRTMYKDVCEAFIEYTTFIGGSSSFDLVPKPYNKLYALRNYCSRNGYSLDKTLYFGDDYEVGGNDWHIFNSSVESIIIDNYQNFREISKSILSI